MWVQSHGQRISICGKAAYERCRRSPPFFTTCAASNILMIESGLWQIDKACRYFIKYRRYVDLETCAISSLPPKTGSCSSIGISESIIMTIEAFMAIIKAWLTCNAQYYERCPFPGRPADKKFDADNLDLTSAYISDQTVTEAFTYQSKHHGE